MPDAQPKPTAAEVLAAHQFQIRPRRCSCGAEVGLIYEQSATEHQADMLAAAGLLATAEHDREVAARALRGAAKSFPASLPLGMADRDYLRGLAAGIRHGRIPIAGEGA